MSTSFSYVIEVEDSASEYAFGILAFALGLGASRLPSSGEETPLIWYGNHPPEGFAGLAIPVAPDDLYWTALLDGSVDPDTSGLRVPFDLVGAIGRLLLDQPHASPQPGDLDHHGRLRFEASSPARRGLGGVPVVDRYVRFIGSLLQRRGVTGLTTWPTGRLAAIGLSHDVDAPERFALLRQAARPWRLRRALRTHARAVRAQAADWARRRGKDDYWVFEDVIASEARQGFRSTFFFAVTPFHAPTGALEDVAYDIAAPRSRRALALVRASGSEIGLHAGYRAHEHAARFVKEKQLLETVSSVEITGLRHHYWNLGSDAGATLRMHEAAGFRYDSSLAFNDHVGFRRSTALPFHPFDARLGRPITTLQLPTICMDGNLFYTSADIDAAIAAVDGLLDEVLAVGGFGSLDWHVQASYPANTEYRPWAVAFQEILRLLAARPELWVTDLGSVERWVADRESRRRDLTRS